MPETHTMIFNEFEKCTSPEEVEQTESYMSSLIETLAEDRLAEFEEDEEDDEE